jgi:hypothetical protein
MAITISNKFLSFKTSFKEDTGLDFNKENMSLYIQYFNARCNDISCQVIQGLTHQLINQIDFLPGKMRLEIAQMISSHDTIKELLRKKS